jgi:putative transposase
VAVAEQRAAAFADKWRGRYPKAVECLLSNLSALTAHLHFPVEHRERVRHSNRLERTFGESWRRVKVIGRLPGEHSCLSLVWAVLDRASVGWRGIDTSVAGIRRLQDLRRQLLGPPELLAAG